jgi:hypothetical protein
MINANGTNPAKYANGLDAIINKMETPKKEELLNNTKKEKKLQELVGYCSTMPWSSEEYISTWDRKLVTLELPSENPGESITFYKHIEGAIFRKIRDDQELGETLIFERDKTG